MTYYMARIRWNHHGTGIAILMLSPERLSDFEVFVLDDNKQFYLICLERALFRIATRLKKGVQYCVTVRFVNICAP